MNTSRFNPYYNAYHCCYCDELVCYNGTILTNMVNERLKDCLLPGDRSDIEADILNKCDGININYRQYIHYGCMKKPDARDVLKKNVFTLVPPVGETHTIYTVGNANPYYAYNNKIDVCALCGGNIRYFGDGFIAYPKNENTVEAKNPMVMHYDCREVLLYMRKTEDDTEQLRKINTRPSILDYNKDKWTKYRFHEICERTNKWIIYTEAIKPKLPCPEDIKHLQAWLRYVIEKKTTTFTDEENTNFERECKDFEALYNFYKEPEWD